MNVKLILGVLLLVTALAHAQLTPVRIVAAILGVVMIARGIDERHR